MHDAFHRVILRSIGELYSKTPALYETEYDWTSFQWIDADNADENMFSYLRKNENSYYIVILNFSPNAYKKHAFGVPEKGVYHELLNTEQDILGRRDHGAWKNEGC